MLGWLALLVLGVFAAATDADLRPVWIIAALWIAANLTLHSYWQFRDTVFLYAAHLHMAIFLLALAGARKAKGYAMSAVYCTVPAAVIVCTALNNIPAYLALARID